MKGHEKYLIFVWKKKEFKGIFNKDDDFFGMEYFEVMFLNYFAFMLANLNLNLSWEERFQQGISVWKFKTDLFFPSEFRFKDIFSYFLYILSNLGPTPEL